MGGEGDERSRACIRAQSWYGTGGRRACAGMRMRGRPRRYLCREEKGRRGEHLHAGATRRLGVGLVNSPECIDTHGMVQPFADHRIF